jgi:hypothetical protein
MRKFIIGALAATSLVAVASAAQAGYWWNGFYYPSCYYTVWGTVCN